MHKFAICLMLVATLSCGKSVERQIRDQVRIEQDSAHHSRHEAQKERTEPEEGHREDQGSEGQLKKNFKKIAPAVDVILLQ